MEHSNISKILAIFDFQALLLMIFEHGCEILAGDCQQSLVDGYALLLPEDHQQIVELALVVPLQIGCVFLLLQDDNLPVLLPAHQGAQFNLVGVDDLPGVVISFGAGIKEFDFKVIGDFLW